MGFEDPNKKGRKRAVAEAEAGKPPAKRPATAAAQGRLSPEQAERVRSNVRALYDSYNALISKAGGALDNGAFQALLRAAQGEGSGAPGPGASRGPHLQPVVLDQTLTQPPGPLQATSRPRGWHHAWCPGSSPCSQTKWRSLQAP